MFLYLLDYLSNYSSSFLVFEYITLRAILSIITALSISLLLGPYLINKFSLSNISEIIRDDGPSSHFNKSGTPTMGGLLIITSLIITTLFWGNLDNKYILFLILTTISFAFIGLADDYQKLKRNKNTIRFLVKLFIIVCNYPYRFLLLRYVPCFHRILLL